MTAPLTPIILRDNCLWALPLAGPEGGILLIDAGIEIPLPANVTTWDSIETQAKSLGFAPEDVRTVLVTHEHIDHAAFAARWTDLGARIVCGRFAVPALVSGRESLTIQREPRLAELRRYGAPESVIEGVRQGWPKPIPWTPCPREAIDVAETCTSFALADGRTLQVISAPGHTIGNLVAYIPETGELFAGDTILPTTIPTPGLHFPGAIEGDPHAPRWRSLPTFFRTIDQIRKLRLTRIYPGHGHVIEDPQKYIDRWDSHHDRRAGQVRAHLEACRSVTAYEIARALFPRLPEAPFAQAMTEVIGHLDVLEENGEVFRQPDMRNEGVIRWASSHHEYK